LESDGTKEIEFAGALESGGGNGVTPFSSKLFCGVEEPNQ
jgi:hypothetical protein